MPVIIFVDQAEWDTFQLRLSAMQGSVNQLQSSLNTLNRKVDALIAASNLEAKQMSALDDALAALTAQVKANTDAEQSALTLINNLADMIKADADDPVKVQALADQLKVSADALAAAVTDNTQAAPVTAP
jgi:chromosome segregation ATPase